MTPLYFFVVILISICSTSVAGSGSACCTMDACAIEKIGLVSQLMALATQIQNSTKSSEGCGLAESSPTTTATATTTTTTTTAPTTPYTESTTTMRQWRYGVYMTGGNKEEAYNDCKERGLTLLRFEKPEELEEFRAYGDMYHSGWSSIPNVNHYFWTDGVKDPAGVWRWSSTGQVIDPAIVAKIIVPTGQESAINLVLTYHPLAIKLTQYDGSKGYWVQTFAIHNICETN